MSVTSTTNRKSYAGDAVTTSFATNPVVFFDSSDLAVSVVSAAGVETALTENTHYTVTGGDGSTGTVNLAGGSAPYGAPAAGVTLLILRQLPLTQPVDLVQNDGSDAEVQERAYDRLTMMVQQLNEVDARVIKLPPVETGSTALTELPFDRASKFLAFDASKNLIAAAGTTEVPVSAFMATVLDDTTAAAARTTLGVDSLPIADTTALVKGSADATKLLRFEVDGFTTATTRVLTPPNFDGTIATLAGTESLSNKTLVAPALGTPASGTLTNCTGLPAAGLVASTVTNTLGADVALNNTGTYFTGPTCAQGSNGTWLAVGTVTLTDTAGGAVFEVRLTDGTTTRASARVIITAANQAVACHLSAVFPTPPGNIKIEVRDITSTSGAIKYDYSTNTKDATLAVVRIG